MGALQVTQPVFYLMLHTGPSQSTDSSHLQSQRLCHVSSPLQEHLAGDEQRHCSELLLEAQVAISFMFPHRSEFSVSSICIDPHSTPSVSRARTSPYSACLKFRPILPRPDEVILECQGPSGSARHHARSAHSSSIG